MHHSALFSGRRNQDSLQGHLRWDTNTSLSFATVAVFDKWIKQAHLISLTQDPPSQGIISVNSSLVNSWFFAGGQPCLMKKGQRVQIKSLQWQHEQCFVWFMHVSNLLFFDWWISFMFWISLFPIMKQHNSLKYQKALFMFNMAQWESLHKHFFCHVLFWGSIWSLSLCDCTTTNWFPMNPTDESLACSRFTFLTFFSQAFALSCTFLHCLQGSVVLTIRS